ncbi:NADPH-dependent curcumin reductase CurA [Kribbella aluminosa]|uniref:NADPH-dependent curcumin reductase CurA n=1 Tax=Kribbella aluminosa TaxID=416017 RepID=A0ABS4UJ58_9ACTN|nr:NADP-dependent oxidoreductase [Kribbella aluminosa]MBP2351692.1 NADPH-dependent curcumin reductase CurA [Kribbella aluminosa]
MTLPPTGLAAHLRTRPRGLPTADDFEIAPVRLASPGPGEVVVRNLFLSLDPAMLMLIAGLPGLPMPIYEIGEPMYGAAVGEVVESHDPALPAGELVLHQLGWREYAVAPAAQFRPVERGPESPSIHLHSGLVAYTGLRLAPLRTGDTVYISSAAGAIGSLAGQIAKLLGAGRVIGSTGSAQKVGRLIDDLGYDAAFEYHDGPVAKLLRASAPDGIDVYFDNVGGSHLRAAIDVLNPHGRIVLCGALEHQLSDSADPRIDPFPLLAKRITVQGFTVGEHQDLAPEYRRLLRDWLTAGAIRPAETIVDGLRNAPQALLDLANGNRVGKTVVRL